MTDPPDPAAEPLDWNLVVTARERQQRTLRRRLARLVRLRPSGFRNVLIGRIDDLETFLTGLAELRERHVPVEDCVGKILPIEQTFHVDAASFDAQLRSVATPLLSRLAHQRFHVRIERRGHKGIINSHASEQALGEYLYSELERRGECAGVDFGDPDVVVAVELLGDVGGIALITRALRQRSPFIRID